jgi:hypothetical protein
VIANPFDPAVDAGDGFRFVVPTGETARIQLSGVIVGLQPGENAARVWELYQHNDSCGPHCDVQLSNNIVESTPGWLSPPNSPLPASFTGVLLGPGEYWVYDNYGYFDPGVSDSTYTNWTAQIDVAPVPLPAAALLFVSALGGLGVVRRRAA